MDLYNVTLKKGKIMLSLEQLGSQLGVVIMTEYKGNMLYYDMQPCENTLNKDSEEMLLTLAAYANYIRKTFLPYKRKEDRPYLTISPSTCTLHIAVPLLTLDKFLEVLPTLPGVSKPSELISSVYLLKDALGLFAQRDSLVTSWADHLELGITGVFKDKATAQKVIGVSGLNVYLDKPRSSGEIPFNSFMSNNIDGIEKIIKQLTLLSTKDKEANSIQNSCTKSTNMAKVEEDTDTYKHDDVIDIPPLPDVVSLTVEKALGIYNVTSVIAKTLGASVDWVNEEDWLTKRNSKTLLGVFGDLNIAVTLLHRAFHNLQSADLALRYELGTGTAASETSSAKETSSNIESKVNELSTLLVNIAELSESIYKQVVSEYEMPEFELETFVSTGLASVGEHLTTTTNECMDFLSKEVLSKLADTLTSLIE